MTTMEHKKRKKDRAYAVVAGASGGTGLVAAIAMLPDTYPKQLFMIAVPTVSMLLAVLWNFIMDFAQRVAVNRTVELELRTALEEGARILADPNASPDTKAHVVKRIESLRLLKFSLHAGRVEAMVG
jgi:hypothetical protein